LNPGAQYLRDCNPTTQYWRSA